MVLSRSFWVLSLPVFFSLNPALAQTPESADAFIAKIVKESQKHRRQRPISTTDALYRAEVECAELAGDVTEYSRHLRLVMHGYVRRGLWSEAEYLTTRMVGSGVPLGLAELALAAADASRPADAIRYAEQAMAELHLSQGVTKDSVRRDCALVFVRCGQLKAASAIQNELLADDKYLVAAAMMLHDPQTAMPRLEQVKALLDKEAPAPYAAATYALACAEKHLRAGQRPEGGSFIHLAEEKGAHPRFLTAMDTLLQMARVAQLHGLTADRDRLLERYQAFAKQIPEGMDWKPLCHLKAARLLLDWGKRAEAEASLALAESSVAKVFVVYAAESMVEIAAMHDRLGNAKAAADWVLKATQTGMSNPHQRARGMAGVRICLYYADRQQALPSDIQLLLTKAKEVAPAPQVGG